MKCLIVKKDWALKILNGEKTLELRGSNTKIRGRIGIIGSKTGLILGEVDIVNSRELTDEEFYALKGRHWVNCSREEIKYKKLYGWELENPKLYKEPKKYTHKRGCIIWINL